MLAKTINDRRNNGFKSRIRERKETVGVCVGEGVGGGIRIIRTGTCIRG